MAEIKKKYAETPLMQQYYGIKAVHPEAILLFRVGDFYETFGDDAIKASSILGITLTRRANGSASSIELAGFPYHALDTYLPKLVRAGERVAVCEQLEDPKTTKKIVKRGVIELVTPGVSLGDNIHSGKENAFLASIYFGAKSTGAAFLDITTGEFYAAEGNDAYIDKLLSNFAPKEIIYQRIAHDRFLNAFGDKHYTYKLDEWVFSEELNREKLCRQFETKSLKGFGIDSMPNAIAAAGAILYYLEFTEHKNIKHLTSISRIEEDKYVWVDKFTIRNLELFHAAGDRKGCGFVDVIDNTNTPMGGRMLKKWIALPMKDISEITARQDVVEYFTQELDIRDEVSEALSLVGDLERIGARIAAFKVLPREIVQLQNSLTALAALRDKLLKTGNPRLAELAGRMNPLDDLRTKLANEIYPDATNQLAKGGVIADGVDMELDDLRRIALRGKDVLAEIQRRESEATGIPSLKISFNNIFGYYIEVRNTHKDKVPEGWIRKQTLTAAERYITEELKEYEEKILGAEEKILAIEQRLYNELVYHLTSYLRPIQQDSAAAAELDCLVSFAKLATERNYCRPQMDDSKIIDIKNGRHPVIETLLPVGEEYIPNDIYLDDDNQQIILITGPNMAGKSALLRQTALIVLMAQMGCFVPASAARIGIVDKIFTRVGASDNISQGESTFMVEMLESASILNNISDRSLILLDEIGRGTSTYDGISIAWAMVEYLHNHQGKPKTLFATHYHELNELEELCERVRNFNVTVKEVDRSIVFLRKLVPGGTEHSFGIHVARMSGMPRWVVERAEQMLRSMEAANRDNADAVKEPDADSKQPGDKTEQGKSIFGSKPSGKGSGSKDSTAGSLPERMRKSGKAISKAIPDSLPAMQLSMFQLDDPVLKQIRDEIKGLDINGLTPLEALNKLHEIKKITGI